MKQDYVIIKPIITEKSLQEAAIGKYTFLVAKEANKGEIKAALKRLFNVDVTNIFSNVTKKSKSRRTKQGKKGIEFTLKKARVTLKEGQKIDVFEEMTQKHE